MSGLVDIAKAPLKSVATPPATYRWTPPAYVESLEGSTRTCPPSGPVRDRVSEVRITYRVHNFNLVLRSALADSLRSLRKLDCGARVSKDGHKRDRASGHP